MENSRTSKTSYAKALAPRSRTENQGMDKGVESTCSQVEGNSLLAGQGAAVLLDQILEPLPSLRLFLLDDLFELLSNLKEI